MRCQTKMNIETSNPQKGHVHLTCSVVRASRRFAVVTNFLKQGGKIKQVNDFFIS